MQTSCSEVHLRKASCSMMRKFREGLSCCGCEQCAKVEPKISMTSVWDKSTVCSCWQLTHAAVPILLKSDGRQSATTPGWQPGAITPRKARQRLKAPCCRLTTVSGRWTTCSCRHAAFLSGWWKLLSFQTARILMCPPCLSRIGNSTNAAGLYAPTSFHVEGFSAGSSHWSHHSDSTVLFPECPVLAILGAIAMPKGVMGALMEIASSGQCDIHLIHAEDDMLCTGTPLPQTEM